MKSKGASKARNSKGIKRGILLVVLGAALIVSAISTREILITQRFGSLPVGISASLVGVVVAMVLSITRQSEKDAAAKDVE